MIEIPIRFFFPIPAIHKVCQNWQNLPPKGCQKWSRFAIIGNICKLSTITGLDWWIDTKNHFLTRLTSLYGVVCITLQPSL